MPDSAGMLCCAALRVTLLKTFPKGCVTLEVFVAKVEQEVPEILRGRIGDDVPFRVEFSKEQITGDLVEFAPRRRESTKSTLAPIPPLVVDITNRVSPHVLEPQTNDLTVYEFRELKRIGQKRQGKSRAIDANVDVWSIWFSVPPVVELRELRRQRFARTTGCMVVAAPKRRIQPENHRTL